MSTVGEQSVNGFHNCVIEVIERFKIRGQACDTSTRCSKVKDNLKSIAREDPNRHKASYYIHVLVRSLWACLQPYHGKDDLFSYSAEYCHKYPLAILGVLFNGYVSLMGFHFFP